MYLKLISGSLAIFWLVLSGYWTNPLILFFGALSVAFCTYIASRIHTAHPLQLAPGIFKRMPGYVRWLGYEIFKANIAVVKNIWFPKEHPISPTVKRIPMLQKTPLGQTIFANSITLTPGTVSFRVDQKNIVVHGVVEEAIVELMDGEMNQRVANLEGLQDSDKIEQ